MHLLAYREVRPFSLRVALLLDSLTLNYAFFAYASMFMLIVGEYQPASGQIRCLACMAGTYTNQTGALLCEPCEAGFFCETGSNSSTQHACGDVNVYCPQQSAAPRRVQLGWYSSGGVDDEHQITEKICDAGSYCVGGRRALCDYGTFSEVPGRLLLAWLLFYSVCVAA
jgi:hypothetical protein